MDRPHNPRPCCPRPVGWVFPRFRNDEVLSESDLDALAVGTLTGFRWAAALAGLEGFFRPEWHPAETCNQFSVAAGRVEVRGLHLVTAGGVPVLQPADEPLSCNYQEGESLWARVQLSADNIPHGANGYRVDLEVGRGDRPGLVELGVLEGNVVRLRPPALTPDAVADLAPLARQARERLEWLVSLRAWGTGSAPGLVLADRIWGALAPARPRAAEFVAGVRAGLRALHALLEQERPGAAGTADARSQLATLIELPADSADGLGRFLHGLIGLLAATGPVAAALRDSEPELRAWPGDPHVFGGYIRFRYHLPVPSPDLQVEADRGAEILAGYGDGPAAALPAGHAAHRLSPPNGQRVLFLLVPPGCTPRVVVWREG